MTSRTQSSHRFTALVSCLAILLGAATLTRAAGDDAKKADKPKNAGLEAVRALSGTWVSTATPPKGMKPATLEFKSISSDTAVMESMFFGSDGEMVNMYTVNGPDLVMTHYCGMGNQPHMRLASMNDGVLKFEFVDGGNMKSRDEAHMDSVQLTIKGDHLTETWSMYEAGKVTNTENFEFKRQA